MDLLLVNVKVYICTGTGTGNLMHWTEGIRHESQTIACSIHVHSLLYTEHRNYVTTHPNKYF